MSRELLPNTKINSLFPQKTPKFNMFKVVIIFFNVLQFLSGLDFGFYRSQSPKVRKSLKLISLLSSGVAIFVTCRSQQLLSHSLLDSLWFIVFALKYLSYVLFLLSLKTSLNYCSFLETVNSIDIKNNLQCASFKTELKVLSTIIFCFIFRTVVLVGFWELNHDCRSIVVKVIQIIFLSSLDILNMSYASIFSIIDSRLKILASLIENSQSNFSSHQFIYKTYVDIVCKYKKAFDPVIVIAMCYNIPEIMATIYYTLEILKLQDKWSLFAVMNTCYMMAVEALVMTVAPAVCAANLSAQADGIRIVLHNKLLMEKTENENAWEINRFISYVEARDCQFRVYKLIPLDVSLIGMVISFCVTYLIVIIQFIHDNKSC